MTRTSSTQRIRIRRLVLMGLLCVAGVMATPAAGQASEHEKTELRGGFEVTWPSNKALEAAQPGDTVRVKLEPSEKARAEGRIALVSLARVEQGKKGKQVSVIKQRSTHGGTFSARIPASSRGRYRLKVVVIRPDVVVRRRAFTQVTFKVRAARPSKPCSDHEVIDVELTVNPPEMLRDPEVLDPIEVRPGEVVKVTFENIGPACVQASHGLSLQVERNNTWTDVPLAGPARVDTVLLQPGEKLTEELAIPRDASPGDVYRVVKRYDYDDETYDTVRVIR